MTDKEMEVAEDSSVTNVEHESNSSISVSERHVSRISKKRLKAKKKRVSGLAYTEEREAFVQGLVNTRKIRRRRKKLEQKQSKENKGHDIFLPRRDGEKYVDFFFINTLSLGENTFKRWVKRDKEDRFTSSDGSESNSNDKDNPHPQVKIPRRQSKMKGIKQKVHNKMTENVLEWLELLPKVPSHYCRSSSSCTYVESVFRSISHMHKVIEEWCGQKEIKAVSRTLFMQNFESIPFNIHSLRPGKRAGEPVVTDIRALEYRNNGEILFKLRHTSAFQFLPQRQQKRIGHVPELLYSRPIPIAESKRKCLQELQNVIAKDHHTFYDNLPFQKDNKTTKGKQS
ncbi:hypothetical protein ILUMI_10716 [Ignelater luminosus]|uniref:Uncharacterized protein n=1 Tax=Ignelater luminosus TaxID=2038154 RepID=A0A8K0D1V5_IGNLU|nr:hypothetical protein ILUMI_10716 [Ignelater luminosus]